MDRQTLRDWVHRYNEEGIAGLKSGHGPGKPPSLNLEQMAELKAMVLQGPDPEKHGVVRWRRVDLRAEVARRYSVEVSKRTVGKWLRKMKLTRLRPRPFHPKKDDAAQAAFKKLRRPGEGGPFGQHLAGWPTGRDMVPGRSPRGAKRRPCLYLGREGLTSADGARQPP